MPRSLPPLRTNLDFMASPLKGRPGLLIRDVLQYSDVSLIIPPVLVECLSCFDGRQTDLDLRQKLVSLTGDLRGGEAAGHLIESLEQAGFLENQVYAALREQKHRAFAEASFRAASHAGASYPEDRAALQADLARYLNHDAVAAHSSELAGLAAPHVSLEGGAACYREAYGLLRPEHKDRTFVVLGTSHYGRPESFGLTRKPYRTPLGETLTAPALVAELEANGGPAVVREDYCHAVEHSIEFQVLFLQHVLGPEIRILPILCGAYARSLQPGGKPEDDDGVARFLGAIGEMAAREGSRLMWVLGIDMAHMGSRYGDGFAARAGSGEMLTVETRDRRRLEHIAAGDAEGFWDAVQEAQDDLHWCGASVLYTFLKARPRVHGEVLRYAQWNIDEESVVSFAALAFRN
jgi:AmmeMemoRadiSam system protein B